MRKLKLTDEQRKEHLRKLNAARAKKYRERHTGRKHLGIYLDRWTFDLLTANLKKDGLTQRQFIEDAITTYIEKKKSER